MGVAIDSSVDDTDGADDAAGTMAVEETAPATCGDEERITGAVGTTTATIGWSCTTGAEASNTAATSMVLLEGGDWRGCIGDWTATTEGA
jgi:hypothetical protein